MYENELKKYKKNTNIKGDRTQNTKRGKHNIGR